MHKDNKGDVRMSLIKEDSVKCIAFSMKLPEEALQHLRDSIVVKEYGAYAFGHALHT